MGVSVFIFKTLLGDPIEAARPWSQRDRRLTIVFGFVLLLRMLYPLFNSPLQHLFSDPLRHWETGRDFLHPDVMGGGDPFMYQLWLYCVREISGGSDACVLAVTGLLCAAMPYGWYRALREMVNRERALWGGILIGLVPGFLSVYGFFMTETLLLTLTGYAFWMTLRGYRKRTVGAFAAATGFWLAACLTRIVVIPMALLCVGSIWLTQADKVRKAGVGTLLAALFVVPAGLHARAALHYFAPLGNLYLNAIYHDSGAKDIDIDYGAQGRYVFGSPSLYNPTFHPLSEWVTSRAGTVSVSVDVRNGRDDWVKALDRERALHRTGWRDRWENFLYLLFAQQWPDSDSGTFLGSLTQISRWLWLPLLLSLMVLAWRRRFSGPQWILPACGLISVFLLALQSEGIMEGRFRKPIEPIVVAAWAIAVGARRRARE